MTTFSLRSLKLRPGEEWRDARDVSLPALELGGQRYQPVPGTVEAELAITRATTGTVFELRFEARLHGPCYRCLKDAVVERSLALREYQGQEPVPSEDLRMPYLADGTLDLTAWARDAIALSLPQQILCRPDCAGLCPVCGRDLNEEPHVHEEAVADPRWAALSELRERL